MPRPLLALTIAAWHGDRRVRRGRACAAALPGHIGFEAGSNSPVTVGAEPRAIAVGDLNGDGHLDFATANVVADTVTPCTATGSAASPPARRRRRRRPASRSCSPTSTGTRGSTSRRATAAPTRSSSCSRTSAASSARWSRSRAAATRRSRSRRGDWTTTTRPTSSSPTAAGTAAPARSTSRCSLNDGDDLQPARGRARCPAAPRPASVLDDFDEDGELDLYVTEAASSASGWATARSGRAHAGRRHGRARARRVGRRRR